MRNPSKDREPACQPEGWADNRGTTKQSNPANVNQPNRQNKTSKDSIPATEPADMYRQSNRASQPASQIESTDKQIDRQIEPCGQIKPDRQKKTAN